MRRTIAVLALSLTAGLVPAQQPGAPPGQTPAQQESDAGPLGAPVAREDGLFEPKAAFDSERTLTGCLDRSEGGFLLRRPDGREVAISGEPDFEARLGHTVRLTGERIEPTFDVKSLEIITDDCSAASLAEAEREDRERRTRRDPREAAPELEFKRDAVERGGLTAQDQGASKVEREMAAAIRRAIVEDDALSTAAHNVTIIVRDGRVVLRGMVRSEAERAEVLSKAETVAGAGAVQDRLKVKPRDDTRAPQS